MNSELLSIQFCGFGGQGVILASVIFGTAAVKGRSYEAVQTQSFGSEARGGECQAELLISKDTIYSPTADFIDILVGMSDLAFNRYLGRLRKSGDVLIDPDLVKTPSRKDCKIYFIEANKIARDLEFQLAGNMVFLGALQRLTQLITAENLFDAICENVNKKYQDINISAAKRGIEVMSAQLSRENSDAPL